MDTGINKIVNDGNGNALIFTALLAAMIANAVPTPADSLYFSMQQKIKQQLEAGTITPETYWKKDIINYYTFTAGWYAGLLIILYAAQGSYKTNAKILIALISGGFVFAVYKKNVEKDNEILALKNSLPGASNGTNTAPLSPSLTTAPSTPTQPTTTT